MMNESRRFIFFGTGAYFSAVALRCLIELDIVPCAVVVPQYPAASHMPSLGNINPGAASKNTLLKMTEKINVPMHFAPEKSHASLPRELGSYVAEFILVACWPYLLSEAVCSTASKTALNLHPSLLPNYRGANPVEAQLRSGERQLGVSLHLLNQAFDSGDIVSQSRIDMADKKMSVRQVEEQTAEAGVELFVEAMSAYGTSKWQPHRQISLESGSAV